MKFNRLIFIVCSLVLLPLVSVHAQTVKDVTEDKTGRYLYSQARNADEKIAYDSALDELKSKVAIHLKSNGQPDVEKGWTSEVQKIVTEKFGVYRVFLYVATENLAGGRETATLVAGQSKSEITENTSVSDTKTPTDNADSIRIIESKTGVEEATNLPSGMIGDIIRMILEDGRPASIGSILEKGKNMRAVNLYGSADTKYANHAYIITLDKGKLYVYSPKNQNGTRTEYHSGGTSDKIKGKMIYWFLKK